MDPKYVPNRPGVVCLRCRTLDESLSIHTALPNLLNSGVACDCWWRRHTRNALHSHNIKHIERGAPSTNPYRTYHVLTKTAADSWNEGVPWYLMEVCSVQYVLVRPVQSYSPPVHNMIRRSLYPLTSKIDALVKTAQGARCFKQLSLTHEGALLQVNTSFCQ